MDINEFYSEDNEYIIRITKSKKFFTQSKYGQYNCTIEFYNNLKLPVLIINCTEKELYMTIQRINELSTNICMNSTNDDMNTTITFESTGNFNSYTWFLTTTNLSGYPEYPIEHDLMLNLLIYSNHMGQNSLRIFLPMTFSFLEVLIYNIYQVLQDLPYFDEMNNYIIQEFMRGEI